MNYNLSDFIDTFLNDFSGKIADDISVKLLILKFLDRNMTTEKIKTEISRQYPEYLLSIKELSFSKKVRRIKKKYTKIYDIPELISINHLIKIILEKHPVQESSDFRSSHGMRKIYITSYVFILSFPMIQELQT